MGRSAAKVENAEESMRELAAQARAVLEQSNPWSLGDSARILASAALPLDPGRISFTGVPEFDLLGPGKPAAFRASFDLCCRAGAFETGAASPCALQA